MGSGVDSMKINKINNFRILELNLLRGGVIGGALGLICGWSFTVLITISIKVIKFHISFYLWEICPDFL